jgi:hypothetical protein
LNTLLLRTARKTDERPSEGAREEETHHRWSRELVRRVRPIEGRRREFVEEPIKVSPGLLMTQDQLLFGPKKTEKESERTSALARLSLHPLSSSRILLPTPFRALCMPSNAVRSCFALERAEETWAAADEREESWSDWTEERSW